MAKNILILMTSPRKNGSTARLCTAFAKGAEEAGHTVTRINSWESRVEPCANCDYCGSHNGVCALQDDMDAVYDAFQKCDVIVLASPLYYYSISAQLKAVVDRLYAPGLVSGFKYEPKESVLIMTCGEKSDDIFDQPKAYYNTLLKRIFPWNHRGEILVKGLGAEKLEETTGLQDAYELGKRI